MGAEVHLDIYDVNGKLIYQHQPTSEIFNSLTLDVSNWQARQYLVSVWVDQQWFEKKLVVMR